MIPSSGSSNPSPSSLFSSSVLLICKYCGRDFGQEAKSRKALLRCCDDLAKHIPFCKSSSKTLRLDTSTNSLAMTQQERSLRDTGYHINTPNRLRAQIDDNRNPSSTQDIRCVPVPSTPPHRIPSSSSVMLPLKETGARKIVSGLSTPIAFRRTPGSVPEDHLVSEGPSQFTLFKDNEGGWAAQSVRVRCSYCGQGQPEHKLRFHEEICPFRSPVTNSLPKGATLPAHASDSLVRSNEGVGGLVRVYGGKSQPLVPAESRNEDRSSLGQHPFIHTVDNRRSVYGTHFLKKGKPTTETSGQPRSTSSTANMTRPYKSPRSPPESPRSFPPSDMACHGCGTTFPKEGKFCSDCGTARPSQRCTIASTFVPPRSSSSFPSGVIARDSSLNQTSQRQRGTTQNVGTHWR